MTKEEKQKYQKQYREANKDKRKQYREANKEEKQEYDKQYHEANKEEKQKYQKEYREANKDKIKEYREANKEEKQEYDKQYREANKDKLREWFVNYYNTNHIFKISCKLRSLIRQSLKRGNYKKNSRTAEILGCSFEEFKEHIEEQFPRDMTWDNSSLWEYDHIIPLSSATSEEEVLRLNHYTNFQPLWEEDNREKSAKLDWAKCPIKYAK